MIDKRTIWTNPIHFFASGFGAGSMPFAPGTFGTLMAIPLVLVLSQYSLWIYAAATILYGIAAVWACDHMAKDWNVSDPAPATSDEIAGFLIAMFAIPPTLYSVAVAFVLFRILDIFKPFPISWLDRNIHGGLGIVLDDWVAGLFTCLLLHLMAVFFVFS